MQKSFSRLWDGYKTDKDALVARNKAVKELRSKGHTVTCFTLRDQIKKYDGLGCPNGSVCNVYFLDYNLRSNSPTYFTDYEIT